MKSTLHSTVSNPFWEFTFVVKHFFFFFFDFFFFLKLANEIERNRILNAKFYSKSSVHSTKISQLCQSHADYFMLFFWSSCRRRRPDHISPTWIHFIGRQRLPGNCHGFRRRRFYLEQMVHKWYVNDRQNTLTFVCVCVFVTNCWSIHLFHVLGRTQSNRPICMAIGKYARW